MDASYPETRRERGEGGEELAATYLKLAGFEILERNLRLGRQEIDILARDGACLVCVEVRLRRGDRCGRAAESLNRGKLRAMRMGLRLALRERNWRGDFRLDLIALDWRSDRSGLELAHYRGI